MMSPPLFLERPASTKARVLFPAPFRPVTAVIEPWGKAPERFVNTSISPHFLHRSCIISDPRSKSFGSGSGSRVCTRCIVRSPLLRRSISGIAVNSLGVYSRTILPFSIYIIRSASSESHERRCSAITNV